MLALLQCIPSSITFLSLIWNKFYWFHVGETRSCQMCSHELCVHFLFNFPCSYVGYDILMMTGHWKTWTISRAIEWSFIFFLSLISPKWMQNSQQIAVALEYYHKTAGHFVTELMLGGETVIQQCPYHTACRPRRLLLAQSVDISI